MTDDVLSLSGVCKRFGEREVLRGVDLSVPTGSIFGFVGKNGAGKTTTMKAILGLLRTDGGEIFVAGERVRYGATPTNRHIGYLPDVPEFYGFLTPREYLSLCGESMEMARGEIAARSEELLSLVGLAGEERRIGGFSRGMKQRLGIAQALFSRPKLLICDEPTSALDPVGRREILDLIASVRQETTVLFSTHILSDVERIATDLAFLDGGKIVLSGTVDEIKRAHSLKEFTVETVEPWVAERLLSAFDGVRRVDATTLAFSGDEARMLSVFAYLAKEGLPVRRVECAEPSLETLFMEVVKK